MIHLQICPDNACDNGECVTVVYFEDEGAEPIVTDSQSYVSANHQLGYVCRCQPGYGGMRICIWKVSKKY